MSNAPRISPIADDPDVRIVSVPAQINSKERLLDYLAQAFSFPENTGRNWDALEELLTDMLEVPESTIWLMHEAAYPSPTLFHPYLEILQDVVTFWRHSGRRRFMVSFG